MTALKTQPLTNLIFSALLGAACLFLSWHYPLGGLLALTASASLFALAFFSPYPIWLLLVCAALPVVDLAPWSGWLSFEEFDLLVLALASGTYCRPLTSFGGDSPRRRKDHLPLVIILLIAAYAFSTIGAMFRGFADAGGFSFGWYQGYLESMNSIRLAKSYLLALCMLPLLLRCWREDRERTEHALVLGITLGLGLAGTATLWERLAFTELLNFSSDYRTTAMFWEMHVGGAALDGYLALTVPFALMGFLRARSPASIVFFGIVLAIAAYACLTTFSRGVYLAIPLGLAVMASLTLKKTGLQRIFGGEQGLVLLLLMIALFTVGAAWVFPTSGYRGMLALCIAVALYYPVNQVWGRAASREVWLTFAVGGLATALGMVGVYLLPKGAYVVFAVGASLTVAALLVGLLRRGHESAIAMISMAAYWVVLTACIAIAWHWGGEPAVASMSVICALLFVSGMLLRIRPLPERGFRWHVGLLSILVLSGFSIAIFSGGKYMSDRFSTSEKDFADRLQHWESGLAQMSMSDWVFGKGLGRYPATHFFAAPGSEHPGGYQLLEKDGDGQVLLSGGRHVLGWGELYRVSQRVSPGTAPYTVSFNVLAEKGLTLHFEVCEKHLLYNRACATAQINVKGLPGEWQKLQLKLRGGNPERGLWYAPKIVVFSAAVQSAGEAAHIDNLMLRDGLGENLLLNGDFSRGMAHWFSSSDRHHMPWHIKSLFFNVLFDQGVLGLALLIMMLASVTWRLVAGSANHHPLAPALMGSLAGFLVVGMFDSLLDVPRVATLFYLTLLLGLVINARHGQQASMVGHTEHQNTVAKGI